MQENVKICFVFLQNQNAKSIAEKILDIPAGHSKYDVKAVDATLGKLTGAWIIVNSSTIFGLATEDADTARGQSFDELKSKSVKNLQNWLAVRQEQERWS